MHLTRWSTITFVFVLAASSVGVRGSAFALQQTGANGETPVALVLPTRRAADAPPAPPPALPQTAHVTPLTLDVVIQLQGTAGRQSTFRRRVSRTIDRVHVAERDGREWLFERNVVDPRRVSGRFVNHAERVIVVYDESALRSTQGIRGWTDVLTLGFDPDLLKQLRPDTQARTIGGNRFVHYGTRDNGTAVREVWWNAAQVLPSDLVTARGVESVRLRVDDVRSGVDAALLQPPSKRFPTYRVIEFADYLERH